MDRIGPYITERKLGTGGMGTVYLARHEQTDERAAVKLLPASLAREPGFLARFDREIAALQQLDNPHVVKIFDSGIISDGADEENNAYYYAMEYVEGETLLTKLRRENRLDWRTTIDFGMQICTALKSAHDTGIIHRDLKPSNLLISKNDVVKLADFGVAQIFASTRLTKTGGIIGTAEFMSPEQAQGHRATRKSDLYALGAVLYTMLTGKPPYSGQTMLDVLHKHQFGQYDSPRHFAPDCPRWLEEVITQLLDKVPDNRPADAYVTGRRLREIPKKVDLSQSEPLPAYQSTARPTPTPTEYESHGHDDLLDSKYVLPDDAPTRTAPGLTGQEDDDRPPRGPGEATMMHALMREELARQQELHPIQKFFDNTWVLVALLVLILLGGWIWYQNLPTPEWHYQEAQRLVEAGDYSTARIEHLNPLLRADGDWPDKAQVLIDESRRLQDEQETASKLASETHLPPSFPTLPDGEAARLLRHAISLHQRGDPTAARENLESLLEVTAGNESAATIRRAAQAYLEALPAPETVDQSRQEFIRNVLARAAALSADGKTDQAEALQTALDQLYRNDPAAQRQLETIRQSRAQPTAANE